MNQLAADLATLPTTITESSPNPSVLVVLPTYNEADNISPMVKTLLDLPLDLRILVVDDNSPDGTGQLADELALQDSRIEVLHRPGKAGLGAAYSHGFRHALQNTQAQFIVQMDCDFSHDPLVIPQLVKVADSGALAIGSRYVEGGGVLNWDLGRRILSRGGSFYASTLLSLPLADVTGGFKCWPRSILVSMDLEHVLSGGYAFQVEMNYRVHLAGYNLKEVPIIFHDRRVGQSKMDVSIAWEAFTMVWYLRTHRSMFIHQEPTAAAHV